MVGGRDGTQQLNRPVKSAASARSASSRRVRAAIDNDFIDRFDRDEPVSYPAGRESTTGTLRQDIPRPGNARYARDPSKFGVSCFARSETSLVAQYARRMGSRADRQNLRSSSAAASQPARLTTEYACSRPGDRTDPLVFLKGEDKNAPCSRERARPVEVLSGGKQRRS